MKKAETKTTKKETQKIDYPEAVHALIVINLATNNEEVSTERKRFLGIF